MDIFTVIRNFAAMLDIFKMVLSGNLNMDVAPYLQTVFPRHQDILLI